MKTRKAFVFTAWLSLSLTVTFLVGVMGLGIALKGGWQPARPPLPAEAFVGSYDRNTGQNASYVYHHALFDFDKKLQQCDVLILGSSHTLYGLSAQQLGEELSLKKKRPIKVFNASIAGGTLLDAVEILQANQVRDKMIIIDLFNPESERSDSSSASMDAAAAWIKTLSSWTEFYKDWALDPLLPQADIGPKHLLPKFRRTLGATSLHDSHTGDAFLLWSPRSEGGQQGIIFPHPETAVSYPIQRDGKMAASLLTPVDIPQSFRDEAQKSHLRVIVTLVPFNDYRPTEAAAIARKYDYPFIFLSEDNLSTWDASHHLTGESRKKATERLAQGMLELDDW